ncbi:hypothetical protein NP493_4815g00000 [Ridgeia piscesae]|uniref:Uncharacterized protein n=1 Tax=Ridgeia piscesae TaxID=27915 RepID=A0AAD9MSW6_RIDPI|nr:hypothetical protein NP493_4815g00000 [Ridgeia piscesae]
MSFTLDVFTISFFSGTFFISFSSPTFIIYLSLCLILCLSLLFISLPRSLQTRSLSLFRHVNYPRLFLSLTLSLSPATLTHFTVFCFGRNLSVFLSPSLSFFSHVNRHLSNMYTHYRSLPTLSLFFMQPCSRPLFFYGVDPTSLFLYLSPATLTHFTIFCCGRHLPPFLSHSRFLSSATLPTLLSSVGSTASLCLSSATLTFTLRHYTTPISFLSSLSLSPFFALFLALFSRLPLSLPSFFLLFSPLPILLLLLWTTSLPFLLTLFLSSAPQFTLFVGLTFFILAT